MTTLRAPTPVGRDPFASFDLDSLVTGAARLRPERTALADSCGTRIAYAALDRDANALAAMLVELGLGEGECALVVTGARASGIVAIVACVRAGLDVALAPPHLSSEALTAFAQTTGAAALLADARYGDIDLSEALFLAAAAAPAVRLVGCLSGEADGAVDLTAAEPRAAPRIGRAPARCNLLTWRDGAAQRCDQHALVASALELLSRARIGMRDPIFSTLAPTSFAGLAAGPFAALLAGCALHLHGPFEATGFLREFDACAGAHLVAPRALAEALAAGAAPIEAASLMLSGDASHARPLARDGVPVIDLRAMERQNAPAISSGPMQITRR